MGKIRASIASRDTAAGTKKSSSATGKAELNAIPRGRAKSGRIWKQVNLERSSKIKKFKRDTTAKKQTQREERKKVQELSQVLRNAKKDENDQRKLRIAENKRKKEENRKKSEIVQVITNPAKLKRMKKKQLRKIEMRDTTVVAKAKKSK